MKNIGYQQYSRSDYVYLNCCEEKFDNRIRGDVILYFDAKALYNREFYIDESYVTRPSKKINRYCERYEEIIRGLYERSIKVLGGRSFQVFQQIAVRDRLQLRHLVGIGLKTPNKTIAKLAGEIPIRMMK
jgi:hypothetical protein